MWERKDLKAKAKATLKTNYWKAFLVSLIIAFVGGNGMPSFNFNHSAGDKIHNSAGHGAVSPETLMTILLGVSLGLVIVLVVISLRVFLGYALEIGGRRFFVRAATDGSADMNDLAFSFDAAHYASIIKTMLWRAWLNFLWYLLLFIPGIVKSYAYSMVPYLLAENPTLGRKRAVELSVAMTRGEKFRIFLLDLSFLGWFLLGLLVFFVGILFVLPYINATKAELYCALRRKALESGLCTPEELSAPSPPPFAPLHEEEATGAQ